VEERRSVIALLKGRAMKLTTQKLLLAALAVAGPTGVHAQSVMPGTYVTQRSFGTLNVNKLDAKGNAHFKINALGGNNHTCEVEGTLRGTRATAEPTESKCVIDIVPKDGWVQVSVPDAASNACRAFCGVRAQFEGEYFSEIPACRSGEVGKKRKEFSQLYKAKEYQNAVAALGSLMEQCGQFLDRREEAEVRNDMAVAYKNMKETGSCLEVLTPLKKDYIDEPATGFAASDQTWGERMVSATRFNWKACGGK
jgi:hypothetical protein